MKPSIVMQRIRLTILSLIIIGFSVNLQAADSVTKFQSNVFIKNWLVCGPFPSETGLGIDVDYLKEHGGEAHIAPSAGLSHASLSSASGKVVWCAAKADDSGKLDLKNLFQPNQRNVAYAYAVIVSNEKRAALLKTGSNDRLKVWLNGKMVHYFSEPRSAGPDEDYIPVLLKKGENHLLCKVDNIGGSWWLYARFESLAGLSDDIFVTEPFVSSFRKDSGGKTVTDVFSVLALNSSDKPFGPLQFDVIDKTGKVKNKAVYPQIKAGQIEWLIVKSDTKLSADGGKIDTRLKISIDSHSKTFTINKKRPPLPGYSDLKVYIVPHSHADLSWPHSVEVSTNLNVQAISESINILKNLPEFKFSEEDVFVLQEFLRRYPYRFEEVKDLLHKNILGCGGFYFGPSEALLGGEGLIRNLYFGKLWLLNTFGINTKIVWNVDEPGHTLQMPQILSKAGIEDFIIWKVLLRPENQLNVTGYVGPNVFRWLAPDGSRVTVTSCPESYSAGQILRTDSFLSAQSKFKRFVQRESGHIKKWDLPPVIMMADGSDCSIPDPRVARNAHLWNKMYGYPQVKIASAEEYFEAIETAAESGKGKISTMSGELPCWWAGTQSVENDAFMLTRHAEFLVSAAEKFSAVNKLLLPDYDYPKEAIDNVWKGKLWVHEHNWGGTDGDISDAVKLATARDTYRRADDLKNYTMETLTAAINFRKQGIPLIVYNSLSWDRKDIADIIVSWDKKGSRNLYLSDGGGKEVPMQFETLAEYEDGSIARARIVFEARVPSLGYSVYYLSSGKNHTETDLSADINRLENRFYKIIIDAKTGAINSIFDKINKREILNTDKYKGNELIALENLGVDEGEEFTDNWWRMNKNQPKIKLLESGPVRAAIQIEGKILNSPIKQVISIYATLLKIDFTTTLDWNGQKKIQVNAVYPFKLDDPRLTYEVPFGMVEYGKESPAAMASHPTVRAANNWIDLSNDEMGVTFATEVTPFDTKDRRDARFHDARVIKGEWPSRKFTMVISGEDQEFERIDLQDPLLLKSDFIIQPILLRSVFSCGDPNLYFTQQGEHSYRFAVYSHKGPLLPHNAVRFGKAHNAPLIVTRAYRENGKLPDSQSFMQVSVPNVLVTVLKKAEDGAGITLRCYETDGKDSEVTISFFKKIKSAQHTNIIELQGQKADVVNGRLTFKIGHNAIETYKLQFE